MSRRHNRITSSLTRQQALSIVIVCFTAGSGLVWNRGLADPPAPMLALVVLDDCDPNFRGDVRGHDDGLRLLAADGKEIRRVGGLSNCQSIAMNHGVTLDPARGRIYARELVGHRVTATDFAGKIAWRVEQINADAMAVDPESGDLWCLVSNGTINSGEIIVVDVKGDRRTRYPVRGEDIAYDQHGRAFWVVGKDIVRVDRHGKEMLKIPDFAAWTCVSVAPIPGAGEAWIVERKHPQVAGSRSRLLRINTKGEIRQTVEREDWNPTGVACEPKSGQAWVVDMRKALVRVPIGKDPFDPLPIPAMAISIGSKSGQVWIATQDEIIRLKYGVRVVRSPLGKPSGQVWLAAF